MRAERQIESDLHPVCPLGNVHVVPHRLANPLAAQLPLSALVLETDAPDMPPHWLYTPAAQRAQGVAQGRNEPAELPRIAQVLAELRGLELPALSAATLANALAALPRLQGLLSVQAGGFAAA